MISKKSVIYRFLSIWWVLITMVPRNTVCVIYQILLGSKPKNSPTQGQPNPPEKKG